MSGPQGSEPTRPWSPAPDAHSEPTQMAPGTDDRPGETPWWQEVKRQDPPTPGYAAPPQSSPYQQPAYPSASPQPQQQAQYYPQYGQQPSPYGYPQQYGAAPAAAAEAPKKSRRGLWIVAAVAVAALAAIALVVVLSLAGALGGGQVLDVNKAEEGVKNVITDATVGYGVENVTDVTCNGGKNPSANEGDTFTCEVTVDGDKREVTAVFVDDKGTYQVDRPR